MFEENQFQFVLQDTELRISTSCIEQVCRATSSIKVILFEFKYLFNVCLPLESHYNWNP